MDRVPDDGDESAPTQRLGIPVPDLFDSLSEWFGYCRAEGFAVPVQVPQAISRAMKQLGLDHTEACNWLVARGLLHIGHGFAMVDMRALNSDLAIDAGATQADQEASDVTD